MIPGIRNGLTECVYIVCYLLPGQSVVQKMLGFHIIGNGIGYGEILNYLQHEIGLVNSGLYVQSLGIEKHPGVNAVCKCLCDIPVKIRVFILIITHPYHGK